MKGTIVMMCGEDDGGGVVIGHNRLWFASGLCCLCSEVSGMAWSGLLMMALLVLLVWYKQVE